MFTKVAVLLITISLFHNALGTTRIVGGSNAYTGQFKHQVFLTGNTGFFCGGSIIAPNRILTAAHCVCLSPKAVTVVAGTTELMSGGQRYRVKTTHCHNFTTETPTLYDIAVLILEKNITYSDYVNEIKLSPTAPFPGEDLLVAGWGLLSYPSTAASNYLKFVPVKAMDLGACAKSLPSKARIDNSHVCTIAPAGMGVCQGDSGSPVINGRGLQVGIVSWGIPCAKGRPDVQTSVPAYYDWILSIK